MAWIEPAPDGCILKIKLQPRSSRSKVVGILDDAIKIAVTSPPVEGRANQECLKLLANLLKIPISKLKLAAGKASRNKKIQITGISAKEASDTLLRMLDK